MLREDMSRLPVNRILGWPWSKSMKYVCLEYRGHDLRATFHCLPYMIWRKCFEQINRILATFIKVSIFDRVREVVDGCRDRKIKIFIVLLIQPRKF